MRSSANPTGVPNLVHIRPRGLVGEWVKHNQILFIYLFIYFLFIFYLFIPLFGNSPAGQIRWQIFAHDGSNDADSRKNVPFWVSLI